MTTKRAIDRAGAPDTESLQAAREIAAAVGLDDEMELI